MPTSSPSGAAPSTTLTRFADRLEDHRLNVVDLLLALAALAP